MILQSNNFVYLYMYKYNIKSMEHSQIYFNICKKSIGLNKAKFKLNMFFKLKRVLLR